MKFKLSSMFLLSILAAWLSGASLTNAQADLVDDPKPTPHAVPLKAHEKILAVNADGYISTVTFSKTVFSPASIRYGMERYQTRANSGSHGNQSATLTSGFALTRYWSGVTKAQGMGSITIQGGGLGEASSKFWHDGVFIDDTSGSPCGTTTTCARYTKFSTSDARGIELINHAYGVVHWSGGGSANLDAYAVHTP